MKNNKFKLFNKNLDDQIKFFKMTEKGCEYKKNFKLKRNFCIQCTDFNNFDVYKCSQKQETERKLKLSWQLYKENGEKVDECKYIIYC